MALNESVIPLLYCEIEHCGLRRLPDQQIHELNRLILQGKIKTYPGSVRQEPVEEALITVNGQRIYLIEGRIVRMQIFDSIEIKANQDLKDALNLA
jgi:hypothetical protein